MFANQVIMSVAENSQMGEARRTITRLAEMARLNDTDRGKCAIIASELATNLVRHAKSGEIHMRSLTGPEGNGVEVVTVDHGPGMGDISKCLQDGYSTAGTPGNGLGAVQRLSTEFDIFSMRPGGTVVLSRLMSEPNKNAGLARWGAVNRPLQGEIRCGDAWRIAQRDGMVSVMVVDGLGHGDMAAIPAEKAAALFDSDPFVPPLRFIENADRELRGTRGAAMAVARYESTTRQLTYCGIGNVSGHLINRGLGKPSRGLFSHNGTVGVQMRKPQEFSYPCDGPQLLVMHSDGLQTRWSLDHFPGLAQRHPALIAGTLYRNFTRTRDDATVVVAGLG